jgi:hypothetical protein
MSTEATIEPVAVEPQGEDMSFVDSFQAFLQTEEKPSGALPAASPPPEAPEETEVKPKAAKAPKAEPKAPLEEIAEVAEDDTELKLPIDDEGEENVVDDAEADKDNPYDKGTPQHRRFAEMRKETSVLKTELETERQTRAQVEAKLQEIEAAAARAQELEEKIKSYEAKITVTNLQESEAYKETIQKPLISIIERSDEIADRYGIDRDELADALEIENEADRRKAFKTLTSGLDIDPDDHVEIRSLAKELQPLKTKKQELLANADKALAELEATREKAQQEQLLQATEERKQTVDKVAKHITTKLPFIKSLEGVNFDELVSQVRESSFDALDTPNKAYSQIAAQLLPKLVKSHAQLTRQVEELSDDLAKYRKQTPRINRDMGIPDSSEEEDGLLDRYKKTFG